MNFIPLHKATYLSKSILNQIQQNLQQLASAYPTFNQIAKCLNKFNKIMELDQTDVNFIINVDSSEIFQQQQEKNHKSNHKNKKSQQNISLNNYLNNQNIIFKTQSKYKALHKLYKLYPLGQQNMVSQVFKNISSHLLKMKDNSKIQQIPLLVSGKRQQINFKKSQIVYLLALMALNLVPMQEYCKKSKFNNQKNKRPNFQVLNNFNYIFSQEDYKTRTIIQYFDWCFKNQIIEDKKLQQQNQSKDVQVFNNLFLLKKEQNNKTNNYKKQKQKQIQQQRTLTLIRQVYTLQSQSANITLQKLIKQKSLLQMQACHLQSNTKSIQQFVGHLKVDFANKYIGGGSLMSGCVQEQIMFANHPQMYISILLCEAMKINQAIIFIGFMKYSKNQGYSWNTKYAGKQNKVKEFLKSNNIDQKGRFKQYIIAIDAYPYMQFKSLQQFSKSMINRQIFKAYVGFNINFKQGQNLDIITGNWGCGAFHGDIKLKFIIQWIACSLSEKKMIYCPYGKQSEIISNQYIIEKLIQKNIGEVYHQLIKAAGKIKSEKQNIFQLILKQGI